jgi:hypothetical protein
MMTTPWSPMGTAFFMGRITMGLMVPMDPIAHLAPAIRKRNQRSTGTAVMFHHIPILPVLGTQSQVTPIIPGLHTPDLIIPGPAIHTQSPVTTKVDLEFLMASPATRIRGHRNPMDAHTSSINQEPIWWTREYLIYTLVTIYLQVHL